MPPRREITYKLGGPNGDCHICDSHAPGRHGYSKVFRDGRTQDVHRYLYESQFVGPLTHDFELVHWCGVPACINLDHVRPGSHQDAMSNMAAHGHSTKGKPHPARGRSRANSKGLKHPRGRQLDWDAIRDRPGSCADVALEFGVSRSTVSRLRLGQHWSQKP